MYDVCIIGAGFSGMYQLHKLRSSYVQNVKVIEAGSCVGGTWYWNRYPGARCDVESMQYSFQFSKELEEESLLSEKIMGKISQKFPKRNYLVCNYLVVDTVMIIRAIQ